MSGVVNSTGAKSGVIGTTELDYEVGDFSPAISGITTTATTCYYTKIGNLVSCHGYVRAGGAGTGGTVTGLPFANGGTYCMGAAGSNNLNWDSVTSIAIRVVDAGATSFLVYFSSDDGTQAYSPTWATNDRVYFNITYRVG